MNPLIAPPKKKFVLRVLNGPDKGSEIKLTGSATTLGRGESNDIIIKDDPKISREHLRIILRNGEVYLESLNPKNPVVIDKKPVKVAIIESQAYFQAGSTKFEITQQKTGSLANRKSAPIHRLQNRRPLPLGNNKKKIHIAAFAAVGVLVLLLIGSDSKKEEEKFIQTQKEKEEKIATQKDMIQSLKEEARKSGKTTAQFRRAQSGFIKGFRDYKQGQYERAIQYFQECLSIQPSHVLCNRYLSLSQKRFNELIQYHMVVGKKSLDKKQYPACSTSFYNVMVMVKDPNDKVYREAKSNYEICTLKYRDRF